MDITSIIKECWESDSILVLDKTIESYIPSDSYKILENHDVLGATIINTSYYGSFSDLIKYIKSLCQIKINLYLHYDDAITKQRLDIVRKVLDSIMENE